MEVATDISYAIYPSLLDAYLRYKRNDDEETFTSLFNKINKVETDQTEDQIRGVEFEKCVNDVINGNISSCKGLYVTASNTFDADAIDEIASKLSHATANQEYIEAIVETHVGNIKLYGIVDFTFPEMDVDLKGTSNYKCNKYKDNAQHSTYSLIRKLNGNPIKAFKYVVSDYKNRYSETYIPTQNMHDKLMQDVFEFIRFIEHFKKYITNNKVFGA